MYDLIVIGGGPAGTAATITAARALSATKSPQARVLLLERGRFPRHKVCGEFVSAESLQLLASLLHGFDGGEELLRRALRIHCSRIFAEGGEARVRIDPPAASIARFDLDAALWRAAELRGVECRQETEVLSCQSVASSQLEVTTRAETFSARSVIDASGRWSRLRNTSTTETQRHREKDGWIGLKAHYQAANAEDAEKCSTDLYFFDGGYCGVQPVAQSKLNICAMVRASLATKLEDVFILHPALLERSRTWDRATSLITTAPLLFRRPVTVRNGVLCAGDAAAFIDPFAGDGISLALRSGTAAATALSGFWSGTISAEEAQQRYRQEYDHRFAHAFRTAARVRKMLEMPRSVRRLALRALRVPAVAECVLNATR